MKRETHEIEGRRKLYMYSFGPNDSESSARQRRFWNSVGEAWRERSDVIEAWAEPVTRAMNERLGEHMRLALDVGCGSRSMALPKGWRVFGVDPAGEMLTGNRSVQGDPHALPFQVASFDACVSRFAMMLDAKPIAAFREVFKLLRLGGTLTMAVWDAGDANPWIHIAETILARELGIRKQEKNEPGAYRLADAAEVSELLSQAGFRVLSQDRVALPYFTQKKAGELFDFLLEFIGPIRLMFLKLPTERQQEIKGEIMSELEKSTRAGSAWVHHAVREARPL